MRLLSPDHACISVDAPSGRRYDGTVLEVTDPADVKAMRAVGYTSADIGGGPVRGGFRCASCDFASFFRTCSRCGDTCERPAA